MAALGCQALLMSSSSDPKQRQRLVAIIEAEHLQPIESCPAEAVELSRCTLQGRKSIRIMMWSPLSSRRVAQALFDLENTSQDLKSELKDLFINSAAQVDISGNRKAVIIHVPYRLRKAYRKIHLRLVRELEKFSGKIVESDSLQ